MKGRGGRVTPITKLREKTTPLRLGMGHFNANLAVKFPSLKITSENKL